MPNIPLVACETTNSICNCGFSRSADQMCCQDSCAHLSKEEEIAAEKSLSIYCQPVEFYNILKRRATKNPSFLQRCLRYKIQANKKRRIQMSVSVTRTMINGFDYQNPLPICIMLAKPATDFGATEAYSAVYRYNRAVILNKYLGAEGMEHTQAKFTLPDINKLEGEIKSGSLCILLVSFALLGESISALDLTKSCIDVSSVQDIEGYCHFGRVPLEQLYLSSEKLPNLSIGERAEMISTIEMHSSFMKLNCIDVDKYISFQNPNNSGIVSVPQQVEIIICAEEVGAKYKSPYDSYIYDNILNPSLSHIIRLRSGNVVFKHSYYNNKLHLTEVTEDFSCPFCLVRCASFKGLGYHLSSSHDLFNFEFWVSDVIQAVKISMKNDVWQYKVVADNVDPWKQDFYFCSKPRRRRKAKYDHRSSKNSDFSAAVIEVCYKADGIADPMDHDMPNPDATGMSTAIAYSLSYADPECIQSRAGSNLEPPAILQFAKTRKLSLERSVRRNLILLQKRQFFHSRKAQPMEWEEVVSDHDSEDGVDDNVADFEDSKMLGDFVDVSGDEKQIMHLWNSFVRKQRVLADGHIACACEAFSKLHGPNLIELPSLLWSWKLLMIKLWNHGLLDAKRMDNCNMILEQFQNQMKSIDYHV